MKKQTIGLNSEQPDKLTVSRSAYRRMLSTSYSNVIDRTPQRSTYQGYSSRSGEPLHEQVRSRVHPRGSTAGDIRSKLACYYELTKFRLLLLVLVSTSLGYYLSTSSIVNITVLFCTLFGVLCIGAGSNSLNQWYERDIDILMERTKNRPLPSGRLSNQAAFCFGTLISCMGVIFLWFTVNTLTTILGITTWVLYLFIYTPLKRYTVLNTWVGAIPGAIPALMGWAASSGSLDWQSLTIFSILYLWQLPHFFAIAWIYRDDYIRGGFRMLSWNDPGGQRTSIQMLFSTLLLILASAGLFFSQPAGVGYLVSAFILGGIFLGIIIFFIKERSITNARMVFRASIFYLPLLWCLIIIDKILT